MHLVKKDRLDILLALRCKNGGCKNDIVMKNFVSIQEKQKISERNMAHQKLHLKAKLDAFNLRLHDFTKGRESEWHKVPIGV